MKQKALNVAVALAFGAVAAPSLAGTISVTPRQFPASLFGSPALAVAPIAYAVSAPLAANVTRYLYVKLDNGAKFDPTKVAAADFALTNPGGGVVTGAVFGTPALSADGTFEVVSLTTAGTPGPINSTISYTPEAGAVTNTGALATPGQQITATVSLSSTLNTTTTQSDADAASNGPVAISANPFTVTIVPSDSSSAPFAAGAGHELSQIDVIGAGAKNGAEFTNPADITNSTVAINFGSFKVTLVPNLFKADGTSVAAATDVADKVSFTINGAFSAFVNKAKGAFFNLDPAAGDVTGASANLIPATTITASAITFSNIPLVTAAAPGSIAAAVAPSTQYYFIGHVDDATPIDPTKPTVSSITFSLTGGGSSTSVPAGATLYNLGPNGGIVAIPTYIPAGVSGYVSYFRVINTGSLAASPSVAVVGEDGVQGPSVSLAFSIAAGGVHIFSASDIERAVGTVSTSTRPRLRFTAPTTLAVQTLLMNPGGTFTTLDTYNTANF